MQSSLGMKPRGSASPQKTRRLKMLGDNQMEQKTDLENESLPEKICVQLASEIEQQLLPKSSPLIDGAEITGWTLYSGMLGGDFFDYHDFSGVCCPSTTQMHIVVGDASGHGLCSSLLMTSIRAYLRARAMQSGNLSQIVADVNKLLCLDVGSSGHFVTIFYASIFAPKGMIEWVRAGHEPALLYNPDTDVFTALQGSGLALGVDPYTDYQLNSHSGLPKGAIVLIGTDGLWEIDQGVWGAHCRGVIKDLVQKHRHENAVSISEVIKRKVTECCGGLPAEDDMTLITVKFGDYSKATGETS
jgi:sigma-B regulation protein RsbU (phosphoserine phosphatase)